MKPMKPRNIIPNKGGEPFTVHQHIILKNFWEYYLGETDKDGVAFGYVMGIENEWGSVYLPEIKPYIIGEARANDLFHIMPPEGYYWEDENEHDNPSSHEAYDDWREGLSDDKIGKLENMARDDMEGCG
jgi:hypothetical protein